MSGTKDMNEAIFNRGALRSRTVSKVSGATIRQIGYWHSTDLLDASVVKGRRGKPRLYSWIDLMKIRVAATLLDQGLPNGSLRGYVDVLEEIDPEWYKRPLCAFAKHVYEDEPGTDFSVELRGVQSISTTVAESALTRLQLEGVLGKLHRFRDAVDMNPAVRAGRPVVLGHRIETFEIAELSRRGRKPASLAHSFGLSPKTVRRVIDFEKVASAA